MAKAGHTPGPWTNGGEGRSIGRDEEMTFIFAASQANVTKKEQRANVRLACAAPDLLEALELYDEFSKANDDWRDDDDIPGFVIKAREAIANAKGESE
jgi:hypothetical protein